MRPWQVVGVVLVVASIILLQIGKEKSSCTASTEHLRNSLLEVEDKGKSRIGREALRQHGEDRAVVPGLLIPAPPETVPDSPPRPVPGPPGWLAGSRSCRHRTRGGRPPRPSSGIRWCVFFFPPRVLTCPAPRCLPRSGRRDPRMCAGFRRGSRAYPPRCRGGCPPRPRPRGSQRR